MYSYFIAGLHQLQCVSGYLGWAFPGEKPAECWRACRDRCRHVCKHYADTDVIQPSSVLSIGHVPDSRIVYAHQAISYFPAGAAYRACNMRRAAHRAASHDATRMQQPDCHHHGADQSDAKGN
jgi:hypothetical protein